MSTKTVKNISGQPLDVVGYGRVEAGATLEVGDDFNSANFEVVEKQAPIKKDAKKQDTD